MSTTIPTLGRVAAFFIACAILFQFILFVKSSTHLSSFLDSRTPSSSSFDNYDYDYDNRPLSDPGRNRHPSVPLSLEDFAALDSLSDTIATTEALRVFGNKEYGRSIHGTHLKDDPDMVKRVRDQIHCWTTQGRWVRQAEDQVKTFKHLGDGMFGKCDSRFMEALDKIKQEDDGHEGHDHGEKATPAPPPHYLGEYDHLHDRLLVREAAKYKWVPDEKVCGPPPARKETPASASEFKDRGLQDDRAEYREFSKSAFCQILGKRDMLVVGDLTQYQLHDLLLSSFQSLKNICHGELGCLPRAPHILCDNVMMKYARNDLVSVPWAVDPELDEFPSGSTVEQQWATPELLEAYPIVLLNRGLFWRPDEVFLSELVFTMKHLWKYYPETMILYRATHPVSNCTVLKDQREDEAIVASGKDLGGSSQVAGGPVLQRPLTSPPSREDDYHLTTTGADGTTASGGRKVFRPTLADVQRQNRIAKIVVEAAGGIFLDTEDMFSMRPDGRVGGGDCARFCAPGPLDAYADLLYNTFRILQP